MNEKGEMQREVSPLLLRANYMDPGNPLEAAIIQFKKVVNKDQVPSIAEQNAWIRQSQRGDREAARTLAETYEGVIASVAYPFASEATERPQQFLTAGKQIVMRAAQSFRPQSRHQIFSNYAAPKIHDLYARAFPNLSKSSFVYDYDQPMTGVYKFLNTVRVKSEDGSSEVDQPRERLRYNVKVYHELASKALEAAGVSGRPTTRADVLGMLIGLGVNRREDLEEMLPLIPERQDLVLRSYYMSDDQISWKQLAENLSVRKPAVHMVAMRGLASLRKQLENRTH